jgi:hypothetical protein
MYFGIRNIMTGLISLGVFYDMVVDTVSLSSGLPLRVMTLKCFEIELKTATSRGKKE